MKQLKINWVVVFWISLVILFIWLIAKQLGFIHTPLLIELIPYITAFLGILAIAKRAGKLVEKLERAVGDIGEMKIDIKSMNESIHRLDKSVAMLDKRVGFLEARV